MDQQHELIVPNEDISFKMFLFEGKDGGYFREKHWHRSIEIFAVLEGELEFFFNEEHLHLEKDEFVLVNSNELHSIHARYPNQSVVLQIPVSSFQRYYLNSSFIYFSRSRMDTDSQVIQLIREMYEIYREKAFGYDLAVQSRFYQLLYLLVLKYRESSTDRNVLQHYRKMDKLSEITDYIKENYNKDITLDSLSSVFGYAPTYISKMFQKYAGCSFKNYLTKIRLEHVVQDLGSSGDALDRIAARQGFPDRKALSKAFRNQYGMTPGQYRKQEIMKSTS
ncbi:MAG: AraC family transcriptional regulator [Parasporobacterium sp.]|nr:AraC family transcriptional regulator [Parasporobacterium sp.]